MLQSTVSDTPHELNSRLPKEVYLDNTIAISDEETSPSTTEPEDQLVPRQSHTSMESPGEQLPEDKQAPNSASQAKVAFLDGARGLAAMLVVVQHSKEFMPDLHFGSVGVDVFFVLSSFLLTWILMKKSIKLLAQRANLRTWMFTMADYFQKRFFRVYPLFFVTVIAVSLLTPDNKRRYFIVSNDFNTLKTLTFEFDYRYHVFWTLPLEIMYYFVIPVFVLVVLGVRRFWWIGAIPLVGWIVHEGVYVYRSSHMPMRPHISTFLTGSLAAVVFVKVDSWIKKAAFNFRWWHMLLLRSVEWLSIAMLLSVCFRGLLFDWVHKNPAPPPKGFPYTSAFLAVIFLAEMLQPSWISEMLEWNVLRFWGKISFSVYLTHTFVIENPTVSHQKNYFDRFFSRLILVVAISTTTYYLVEYPSQLLAQRISKFLASKEGKGSDGSAKFTCIERITKV